MTSTDPGHLRTWLSGTKFPADKSDLIHQAEQNDAPDDVLAALREMPPATYGNRAEVASSVRIPEQQTDTEKAGERRRHSHPGRAETEAETPTNPIAEVRGDNPKRSDRES